ncbi:lymphocyte antigen 6E-like [Tachyglossus aculeatus]|uniref:lymphocyte antigen 6E-like n=1 Tax=Tachyglossus aculeatus TaxID=9261 RepID=UPI0018F5FA07|nr:lymphocyte antigen 6E-like [Tachyglossus aculeatus]
MDRKMGKFHIVLLVVLLLGASAHSLRCHFCQSLGSDCKNAISCAPNMKACISVYQEITNGSATSKVTVKECTMNCELFRSQSARVTSFLQTVKCCDKDLCNWASSVSSSFGVVVLGIGVSLTCTLLGVWL